MPFHQNIVLRLVSIVHCFVEDSEYIVFRINNSFYSLIWMNSFFSFAYWNCEVKVIIWVQRKSTENVLLLFCNASSRWYTELWLHTQIVEKRIKAQRDDSFWSKWLSLNFDLFNRLVLSVRVACNCSNNQLWRSMRLMVRRELSMKTPYQHSNTQSLLSLSLDIFSDLQSFNYLTMLITQSATSIV